ncbi:GNAT family N-acetyltransferase [Candidatus Acetothermia bacterium]|nr:GNAT family N-acetyltransferase [Candidatus Acetothermia bacterium]
MTKNVSLWKRLDEVSLNSWPALQQILFDGWILRFAKGYTKRANSVNPLYESRMDVNKKIDTCEKFYRDRGLSTIFRLTPFSSPTSLDQILEKRGYKKVDPSFVLYLNLKNYKPKSTPSAKLRCEEDINAWLKLFCKLSESSLELHQTHKEILRAISSRRILASLIDSRKTVACGMGVLENDYFGLFDLVTAPQERNKGYGAKLVLLLLRWAKENGASHAYLQVVSSNTPARHLYAKLGFQEAYQYWYRIR